MRSSCVSVSLGANGGAPSYLANYNNAIILRQLGARSARGAKTQILANYNNAIILRQP